MLPAVVGLMSLGLSLRFASAQETPPASPDSSSGEAAEATEAYPSSRYDKIRIKSPFEFELAKPKPEEAVDPFQDLVLAGYAGSANRVTVYLANTKTQERMTIPADAQHNDTGFRVVSVNRGTSLRTTTATLEKNGVTKELAFDSKALSSMVASGGSGGAAAAPGARGPGGAVLPGQAGRAGLPNATAAGPPKPYVSPSAFIANRGGAPNPGLPQANGNPAPTGVNLAGNMVNQNNGQVQGGQPVPPQPVISPQPGGVITTPAPAAQSLNQPRRRVVLPSQR